MSDTTPRPDETPADQAVPEQPPAEPTFGQPQPQYAEPQLPPPYPPATGTAVAPPNQMSPSDERTWGTIAHAGTLGATILSGGTLGFVCALVIYLIYKDRGPFVHHHAANALNVQIFGAIGLILGIVLTVTIIGAIIGIPLIIAAGFYILIVHIVGAIKANNGEWWNPPMTPQFVK